MGEDKKYLIYTALFLTLLSVFFYHFIHNEQIVEMQSIENDILQNKQKIFLIKKFNDSHKNLDEEISILADRHFRITEALPAFFDEEGVVEFLNEAAMNNRLKVLLLTSDDIKEDNNIFIKIFHMRVRGDYFNILDFLFTLNNSHNFFDIKQFYLKNDDKNLVLDMEINCYFTNNNKR